MVKLDKIDLKLLYELEQDARQPLSKIAKTLKTSQQVTSYRLNSLMKKKIIGGFYTFIDITKLGYTNYRTMIRLGNISKESYEEIIDYFMKHPSVLWLVECGGRWDLIVNIMAKHIILYHKMLSEIRNKFPSQIQNYDVLTSIEVIYFGRDYFSNRPRRIKTVPYFGREYKPAQLDKTDLKILNLISENARLSSVDIASKLAISSNTAILRIKQLKQKGVIQGFKPLLHLENTSYHAYKALIKFHNITEEKEKQLINYLREDINVGGVIRLVGLWDFEIEFEVKSREGMLNLTREVRDKFKGVIKEFELIQLFHEYRYNFFPKELVK